MEKNEISPAMQDLLNDRKAKKETHPAAANLEGVSPEMQELIQDRERAHKNKASK